MKTNEQIFRAASATRSEIRPGKRHRLLYLSLLLLALSTNCDVLQGAVPILGRLFPSISGKMDKQAELIVEVQDSLLRLADEYSMGMVGGVDNLRRGTDALFPAEVLHLKIAIGSETWSIAFGSNVVANLIDMTVFVTVMRMTLEDYWQPKVFGKSALPRSASPTWLKSCRNSSAPSARRLSRRSRRRKKTSRHSWNRERSSWNRERGFLLL
jgi:hypothetical protein